ncbi:unnamed protein product [Heterosigma akashiwo]
MSFRDIHKALDSVPEDVRWVSCLFATAGALYAYKTEVLSIAAMVGLTEHVMPYAFGCCVLVMLLVRGSLARSRGHPLIPDFLLEGLGPLAFMGLVGGYATLEFLSLARRADGGLKSWTGLVVVSLVSGFFSHPRGQMRPPAEPSCPRCWRATSRSCSCACSAPPRSTSSTRTRRCRGPRSPTGFPWYCSASFLAHCPGGAFPLPMAMILSMCA